jgi:Flp pilus assembly protein TadD
VHYRRVSEHHPSDAKAWENLGNALAMIPDLASASVPLQTAIDLGAQSDEVYVNRARAYRMEGSKDMATSILEFLLNRNAHDYLAVLWSAKFAEEDGNPVVAKELFRKSAKLSAPRSPWPELASQGSLDAKVSVKED